VAAIEPGRAIVLKGWGAFVLQPIDEKRTRLIVRSQGDYNPDLKNPIFNFFLWRVVFEPVHFIMERKMRWASRHELKSWLAPTPRRS